MGEVREAGHAVACGVYFGRGCGCSVQRVAELERLLGLVPKRARPLVLVDVDGVLADFVGAFLDFVASFTGQRFTHNQVTAWDMVQALGLPRGTMRAFGEHLDRVAPEHEVFAPIPGAVHGLAMLRAAADVRFATAPLGSSRMWAGSRDRWLAQHFGSPPEHVFHIHEKHHLRADFLIDDKPENVEAWQAANPTGLALLFDQPWNRHAQLPRILGWPAVARMVAARSATAA